MRVLLCCLGLLLALPASANSLEPSICRVRETVAVERMEDSEKLCRSFVRALAQLPETAAEQARGMLTPESLETMVLMTGLWMGAQGVPIVGQAVDAALLALGMTMLAGQMGEITEALWAYVNLARSARNEQQLDKAAAHLSKAMTTAGVNLVGFILTRRAVARLGSGPPATMTRLSTAGQGSAAAAMAGATDSSIIVASNVVTMSTGPSPSLSQPTAGQASTNKGPGNWEAVKPTGSEQSQLYQQQITGRPATQVYKVNGVEFDGFKDGALREAKGPGYGSFFEASGKPAYWYENSGKFRELMTQAANQSRVAKLLGLPLKWHIADAEVAVFLRRHFTRAGLDNIEVIHTPMLP